MPINFFLCLFLEGFLNISKNSTIFMEMYVTYPITFCERSSFKIYDMYTCIPI